MLIYQVYQITHLQAACLKLQWNSLPVLKRQININIEQFKRLLKTFFLGC